MAAVFHKPGADMGDAPHVALLNNLGGASVLERSVLLHELVQSSIGSNITHIVGPAEMKTSLAVRGFSISTYPLSKADLKALEYATSLPAWPGVNYVTPIKIVGLPDGVAPVMPLPSQHKLNRRIFQTHSASNLLRRPPGLDALYDQTLRGSIAD